MQNIQIFNGGPVIEFRGVSAPLMIKPPEY